MKKSIRLAGCAIACACALALGTALAAAAPVPVKPGTAPAAAFPAAENCGCHAQRIQEWSASMHAKALGDPAYVYKRDQADKATKGALGAFCDTCHAPAATMAGALASGSEPPAELAEGISCSFCHQVTGTSVPIGNTSQLVVADGTRRAQIKDPKAPHAATYSAFHEDAAICGGCHNVNHPINGMHLEATYAEWLKSPYAKEGVACQRCHMGDQAGISAPVTGEACAGGPSRDNIFYMTFVGANVGQGDATLAKRNLESAATVELDAPDVVEPGSPAVASVKITNVGAGHYLPTGLTEVREMWLEIVSVDEEGAETVIGERRFGTILQDAAGKSPVELWEATKIKSDDRIAPRQSVTVTAPIELASAETAVMLEARLKYRSLPEEMAQAAKVENPVTLMASAEQPAFGSEDAKANGYTAPADEERAEEETGTPWGAIIWVGLIVLALAVGAFALMRTRRNSDS